MAKRPMNSGFPRPRRKDDAARRADQIKKRANEEFYDEEYDEYDYERSVKVADRGCLIAFAAVMVIIAIVLLIAFMWVSSEINGKHATATGTVQIDVPSGSGGSIVAGILLDNGLIGNDAAFRVYARFNGAGGSFRTGTFNILAGSSYDEILGMLTQNLEDRETVRLTFPPGRTIWQYGMVVEEAGICTAQEFVDAANDIDEFSDIEFFQYIDYQPNTYMKAEGYMAPETYDFYVDETPHNVARRLYQQFNKQLQSMTFITETGEKTFYERLEQQDLTLREAMTLASIVEEEASLEDENQALVAGVFWNRLRGELPTAELPRRTLGSDVTFYYIRDWIASSYGGAGNWESVPDELYYAYATADNDERVNEGLPAGPVCNPGISAIKAALQPVQHDYFWFLTDAYGLYYYAETWNKHTQNLATMEVENEKFAAEQDDGAADGPGDEPDEDQTAQEPEE